MQVFFAALLAFTVSIFYGPLPVFSDHLTLRDDYDIEGSRFRREVSQECRASLPPPPPHHPQHHHPHQSEEMGMMLVKCCPIPVIALIQPEVWTMCSDIVYPRRVVKRESHPSDNNHDDARQGPPPIPPLEFFQEKRECFLDCVFNTSGYTTNDGMLNEEVLSRTLTEKTANDTKWASLVDPTFKKCIAAAKEVNSQSQQTCKPGAAEYMKCTTREFFFNCPNDVWINSPECSEYKNKLEKCPNVSPA